MILLLGATGYFGQAFATELRRRGKRFVPLTRRAFDYTNFDLLFDYVRRMRPEFLINAAGYAGRPNVDAAEDARQEVFNANVLLPQTIARVCLLTNTPWGHMSSGCIYTGAKVIEHGTVRIENDLSRSEVRRAFAAHPEQFLGFTEQDEPNFSFTNGTSNVCSGTKVLAEEALRSSTNSYIWRPRIPFNERDEPCNLLSKLLRYPKIYDSVHSLSHLEDTIRACIDLWELQAPFGIYNVTNPGAISTRQVVQMIQRILKPNRFFEYWIDDEEFYRDGARAARSNCILDVSKLLGAGIHMRPVENAIEDSLRNWKSSMPMEDNGSPDVLHDNEAADVGWSTPTLGR
jgi:dTDP-4-dehydrorhamnose reductase